MVLVGVILFGGLSSATSQTTIFEKPLSPRIANYHIQAVLDDQAKCVTGEIVLTWHNPSDDPIDDLQFHLYTNAFTNTRSTFIREMLLDQAAGSKSGRPKKVPWAKEDGWGWIRINSLSVDGRDVTERITFYQPDDGNPDDKTVIRVPLEQAIAPRATAQIEISFESRIPQCHRRTGWWQDDFFMMAHWFPKIGVYETPGMRFVPPDAPRGQWNCHQFHAATEFYADYGVYDVHITLPEKYVVGTTGLILEERRHGDGTKTVIAHAEDVHDFAWVADARFQEETRVWHSPVDEQTVDVRLLYQPGHECVVDKYLSSIEKTLDHVVRWLGPGAYPYPNLTVVDPRVGSSAGGMEYPNLITGGASWWVEQLYGEGNRRVESVTIHEFMHQIWYGIVGNNEFEEAWLDEGFTTYSQNRIMAELFGETTSRWNWFGITGSSACRRRASYASAASRNDAAIADPTFAHGRGSTVRNMAYNKTSLMLKTLENHLGRDRFDQIMRTYYQRWKFRHPNRHDFVAVANEVGGENLDWFFDQLVDGRTVLDYAVASIANIPLDAFEQGILDDQPQPVEHREEEKADATTSVEDQEKVYQCTVVFRRVGEVVFPMDTLVEFSDGEVLRNQWDGRGRVKTFRFTRKAKVVRAAIDPDQRVPLDVDRTNNSLRMKQQTAADPYTWKGFFLMQSLLQLFGTLG